MGRVTQRTLARRLRLLCIIATAVLPLTPGDIIDELAGDFTSKEDDTRRRVFYGDLRWLRDLGVDVVFSRKAGGYVLYALLMTSCAWAKQCTNGDVGDELTCNLAAETRLNNYAGKEQER